MRKKKCFTWQRIHSRELKNGGKVLWDFFLSPEDHLDVENNQVEGDANPGSSIQEGDDLDEQFSLKLFSVLEEEKEEMKTLLIDVPKEVIPSSAIKRFKKYNYLLIYILENFRTSEVKLSLILL